MSTSVSLGRMYLTDSSVYRANKIFQLVSSADVDALRALLATSEGQAVIDAHVPLGGHAALIVPSSQGGQINITVVNYQAHTLMGRAFACGPASATGRGSCWCH